MGSIICCFFRMRYQINECSESFEEEYSKSKDILGDVGASGKRELLLKLLQDDES